MKSIILGLFIGIAVFVIFSISSIYHDPLKINKINRVYDGDTFYINLKGVHSLLGENIGIRINGIDTPEIRGSTPCVKEMAKEARNFLESRLRNGKKIKLSNCKRGKYFRIIADELIKKGYAVSYDGSTKSEWTCQKNGSIYR